MNIDSSTSQRNATPTSGPNQSGEYGGKNSFCEKSREEDRATVAQLLQALQAKAAENTPNQDPSTNRLKQLITLLGQKLGLSGQDDQGLGGAQKLGSTDAPQITDGEDFDSDALPQSSGLPQRA